MHNVHDFTLEQDPGGGGQTSLDCLSCIVCRSVHCVLLYSCTLGQAKCR